MFTQLNVKVSNWLSTSEIIESRTSNFVEVIQFNSTLNLFKIAARICGILFEEAARSKSADGWKCEFVMAEQILSSGSNPVKLGCIKIDIW